MEKEEPLVVVAHVLFVDGGVLSSNLIWHLFTLVIFLAKRVYSPFLSLSYNSCNTASISSLFFFPKIHRHLQNMFFLKKKEKEEGTARRSRAAIRER